MKKECNKCNECDYTYAEIVLDDDSKFQYSSVDYNNLEFVITDMFLFVRDSGNVKAMFNLENIVRAIFD